MQTLTPNQTRPGQDHGDETDPERTCFLLAEKVLQAVCLARNRGSGIGRRLLEIGIAQAQLGHNGPIRLEATINAEAFYRKCGFRSIGRGCFSHGLGGEPIEIVHMEL